MKYASCPLCHPEWGNWDGDPEWVTEVTRRHERHLKEENERENSGVKSN